MKTDPVPPPVPLSYRPRDAARLLGVSARTLYEWTRAGRVRCVRVGPGKRAAVLYPVDALRQLLAAPAVPSSTN
jgi:excisionase family DNA binding protein